MCLDVVQNYIKNTERCAVAISYDVSDSDERNVIFVKSTLSIFMIVAVMIILVNVALIYALYKTNRPLSITSKLFIYLSTVDILSVTASILIAIATYFIILPCLVTYIANLLVITLLHIGLVTFDTISILRYLSIKRPFNQSVSNFKMCLLISLELLGTALYMCFLMVTNYFVIKVVTIGFFVVNTTSIVFVNVQSYRIILNQISLPGIANAVEMTINPSSITNGNESGVIQVNASMLRAAKQKKSAAVTLIIITLLYFFLNMPVLLYFTIEINQFFFEFFARLAFLSNNGINSLVYILRRKKIRTFLWKRITRRQEPA